MLFGKLPLFTFPDMASILGLAQAEMAGWDPRVPFFSLSSPQGTFHQTLQPFSLASFSINNPGAVIHFFSQPKLPPIVQ